MFSGETRKDLINELKKLRQRRGLSLDRLRQQPTLLVALGYPRPEHATVGQDALVRLAEVIDSLGSDPKVQALKSAYALDTPATLTVEERRRTFGTLPHVQRLPETLEDWENQAIEELATRLLARPTPQPGLPRPGARLNRFTVEGVTDANGHLARVDYERTWMNDDYASVRQHSFVSAYGGTTMVRCLLYRLSADERDAGMVLLRVIFNADYAPNIAWFGFSTRVENLLVNDRKHLGIDGGLCGAYAQRIERATETLTQRWEFDDSTAPLALERRLEDWVPRPADDLWVMLAWDLNERDTMQRELPISFGEFLDMYSRELPESPAKPDPWAKSSAP